jgi:hypothetical protein
VAQFSVPRRVAQFSVLKLLTGSPLAAEAGLQEDQSSLMVWAQE